MSQMGTRPSATATAVSISVDLGSNFETGYKFEIRNPGTGRLPTLLGPPPPCTKGNSGRRR